MTLEDGLLEAAMGGHAPAIARLLAASRADLGRYARRHCQSEDVEDAVQDALWIISLRVSTLRVAGAFASWSFQIIRRVCMKLARSRLIPLPAEAPPQIEQPSQELRLVVTQALARLPAHYREVLILSDIMGFSAEETASRLGLKLEAAKARLHRARQSVRDDLSSYEYSTPN